MNVDWLADGEMNIYMSCVRCWLADEMKMGADEMNIHMFCVCVVELAGEVKVHADWPADGEMNIHVLC